MSDYLCTAFVVLLALACILLMYRARQDEPRHWTYIVRDEVREIDGGKLFRMMRKGKR